MTVLATPARGSERHNLTHPVPFPEMGNQGPLALCGGWHPWESACLSIGMMELDQDGHPMLLTRDPGVILQPSDPRDRGSKALQ